MGIDQRIATVWAEACTKLGIDPFPIEGTSELIDDIELEARDTLLAKHSDLVSMFDLCLGWLSSLALSVKSRPYASDDDLSVVFASLLGAASAHFSGVRRLVWSGLGASARILLRSSIEYLWAMLVIVGSEDLPRRYRQADTPDEATRFWNEHLRPKPLDRALSAIEARTARGIVDVAFLSAWRRSSVSRLSGFVHPSFIGSAIASTPDMIRGGTIPGVLGASSLERTFVLAEGVQWIWYFSLLLPHTLPRREGKPVYYPGVATPIDQCVSVAWLVLQQVVREAWQELERGGGDVAAEAERG